MLTIRTPLGLFLTAQLVLLKITGGIEWSWWWVTAPLWGSLLLPFIILFIIVLKKS